LGSAPESKEGSRMSTTAVAVIEPCPNAKRKKQLNRGKIIRYVYECKITCMVCRGQAMVCRCPVCEGCGLVRGVKCERCQASGRLPASVDLSKDGH
jgi:hypothetical protein